MSRRRPRDQYFTPEAAVGELLAHTMILGTVLEPCVGTGNIAAALICAGHDVVTNDLDPQMPADFHADATDVDFWCDLWHQDWIVSNPPFSQAAAIIPFAYDHAIAGIAMLLRLSYLEPCDNRADWLRDHPPTSLICIPRISFTGDGKTDSVATAWFVWEKDPFAAGQIYVVPRVG